MQLADTGSIRIAWDERGSGGPPVVVVPQWFLSSRSVSASPLVTALSGRRRVIFYDRRGTGSSDKPGPPYTAARDAEDLVGLLNTLKLDGVILLGLGVRGSQVALSCAAKTGDRVQALICIGGTPKWAASAEWPYGIQTGTFHKAFTGLAAGDPPPQGGDPATSAAMLEDWSTTGAAAAMDMLNHTLDEDLRPILKRVHSPALIIHLRQDRLVSFEAARWLAESLGRGQLEVFDGERLVPMSAPFELAGHIDEFLSLVTA